MVFAVAYFITSVAVLMMLRLTGALESQTVVALQALSSGFFVNANISRVVQEIRVLHSKVNRIWLILAQLDLPITIMLFLTSMGAGIQDIDQNEDVGAITGFGIAAAVSILFVIGKIFFVLILF